ADRPSCQKQRRARSRNMSFAASLRFRSSEMPNDVAILTIQRITSAEAINIECLDATPFPPPSRLTASDESRAARATLRREHEACSVSTVNAADFDELSESEKRHFYQGRCGQMVDRRPAQRLRRRAP